MGNKQFGILKLSSYVFGCSTSTHTMNKKLLFFSLWTIIWVFSLFIFKAEAEAPMIDIYKMSLKEATVYYSDIYGNKPSIALAVLKCESQYGTLPDGDGGKAKGAWQYWDDTWHRHYKEFHSETGITLTKGNPIDDTQLAMWAFSKGYAGEWSTYRSIKNGGKYTFYSKSLRQTFTIECSL